MNQPRTHIVWTAEERALITRQLISVFEASGLPKSEWEVTQRMIVRQQFEALPEDRTRHQVRSHDIQLHQAQVNDYVTKSDADAEAKRVNKILDDHALHMAEYAVCPRDHAMALIKRVEELSGELSQLNELLHTADAEITDLKSKLAKQLHKPEPVASPKAHIVTDNGVQLGIKLLASRKLKDGDDTGTVLGSALLEAASKLSVDRPKYYVGATHIPQQTRSFIDKLCDVVWMQPRDTVSDVVKRVKGRHVFVIENQATVSMMRAMKEHGESHTRVRGANELKTAIIKHVNDN